MTRERSNPLVLAAAGAVAAALLLFGLPRLAAHAIVAPVHDEVETALTAGSNLSPETTALALARYGAAVPFAPEDAGFRRRQGQLNLRVAADADAAPDGAMREARDHFAEAVARAPSRSFDWVLLARAELALGADAATLEPVLRLAYLTGPYEASSMLMRANLVLVHWEAFSPGMQDVARADLERLWQTRGLRQALFGAYLQWGFRERILFREIALADPAQARRFDRLFMRWLQGPGQG